MSGTDDWQGMDDESWLLLVEDSSHDRELTLHALRRGRFAGRIETARDGVEALDLLAGRGSWAGRDPADLPSAILLDIKMPMLGGIEVLRELKRDDLWRDIPVVMLTSSAEDRDLATCYALGANSYIVKPVEIDKFFQAVLDIGRYWLVLNRPPREARHGIDAGAGQHRSADRATGRAAGEPGVAPADR
ncbi:response regulator [Spongisporangium articulatum]|uniref:Response regulator n=1 Tax=Spongisporangium articulatum TaxID=3362603 RepID=A0ABW8AQK0_9ACTN